MRLDPFPLKSPLALTAWCLGPLNRVTLPGLLAPHCPLFTLPTPSWCSARSVTLSTHSAWRRPSGPCPNIMTLGAAAAAGFCHVCGRKGRGSRFGHKGRGSGGMEERGVSEPVGFAIAVFLPISCSTSLECERCRHAYHPACLRPSYPTRATRKRRHWVRDEAPSSGFGL